MKTLIVATTCLVAMSATGGSPDVEPVSQFRPMTESEVEKSAKIGAELRRLAKAGRMDEHEAIAEAMRQFDGLSANDTIRAGRVLHGLGKTASDPDGFVGGRPFREIGPHKELRSLERSIFAAEADVDSPLPPLNDKRGEFVPVDQLVELAERTAIEAAAHRQVKMRSVMDSVGMLTQPTVYPPFFWLPMSVVDERLERLDATITADLEAGIDRHSEIMLAGLNIKLFLPEGAECCGEQTKLAVSLVHGDQVENYTFRMVQREPGVYYLHDPGTAAVEMMDALLFFPEYPLFTIRGLEGVGYEPAGAREPIAYAVRWMDLELEFGAHMAEDPEGVVR